MISWNRFEKFTEATIMWAVLAFILFAIANIGALGGAKHKENSIIESCIKSGHYYTPKYNLVCTPLEITK